MKYHSELNFVIKFLSSYRIKVHKVNYTIKDREHIDMNIRKQLGLSNEYEKSIYFLNENIKSNTIYKYTDIFYSHYFILSLPNTSPKEMLIIGPYTSITLTKNNIIELIEKNGLPPQYLIPLQNYFNEVPYQESDSFIITLLTTLGEVIWDSIENFRFEILYPKTTINNDDILYPNIHSDQTDVLLHMEKIEQRYRLENEFINYISQGLSHKVASISTNMSDNYFEKRSHDPIRNMQNYCIIFNTLLRKATEKAEVHPFYIDKLSSYFGYEIEKITSMEKLTTLQQQMIIKYCGLVKNKSMKGYSLPIQKTIAYIDSDFSADLSLHTISKYIHVNASYLSSLFKKETGTTLTEYVNNKRIQYAISLLTSSNLQIQTIAQYCGILDVNYFTKLFKKKTGYTPKKYRENYQHSNLKTDTK